MLEIHGNWKRGVAFDRHIVSSEYLGEDQFGRNRFENKRSEMGELVYRLKYRRDSTVIPRIVELLDGVRDVEDFDLIVPIPPTVATRTQQPVRMIAEALGKRRGVPVLTDLLSKNPGGKPLKDVEDAAEKESILKGSMALSGMERVSGLKVLLVDDLFQSGATLRAATAILLEEGKAASVSILTMTKTR